MAMAADVAARQLIAYNRRAIADFLDCFAPDVVLHDLTSDSVKLQGESFAQRYGAVFEHSEALHADVTARVTVAHAGAEWSYAIDFEQFSGLLAPVGGALDGSTGMSDQPAAADIVVMYEVNAADARISRLWATSDADGVGRRAEAARIQQSAALSQCLEVVRRERGLPTAEALDVEAAIL